MLINPTHLWFAIRYTTIILVFLLVALEYVTILG